MECFVRILAAGPTSGLPGSGIRRLLHEFDDEPVRVPKEDEVPTFEFLLCVGQRLGDDADTLG